MLAREALEIVRAARERGNRPYLPKTDLSRASLVSADLHGAILSRSNLREANLSGANLCGARLRDADLVGANLSGADLCGANLSMANLRRANLSGASLGEANFCGAELFQADFHEAQIGRASLGGAKFCGAIGIYAAGPGGPGKAMLIANMRNGQVWFYLDYLYRDEKAFRLEIEAEYGNNVHARYYYAQIEVAKLALLGDGGDNG